jgi:hypothetical protein
VDLPELLLLQQIAGDLRAIRVAIERTGRTAPQPGHARHMRAIHAAIGSRSFTSSELLAHSRVDKKVSEAITALVGVATCRRVGKFLASVEGQDFDGLRVGRSGSDRDGVIWRVCEFETSTIPHTTL